MSKSVNYVCVFVHYDFFLKMSMYLLIFVFFSVVLASAFVVFSAVMICFLVMLLDIY